MTTPTTHSHNQRLSASNKRSLVLSRLPDTILCKHGLAVQKVTTSRTYKKAYVAFGYRFIFTSYHTPSLSIHTFSPVLERARHSIKRALQLCAHEEPDHIRQQAPKKLPRLVYSPLITRTAVPQELPAFRADQQRAGVAKRHASRKLASST
jgi:hypothetical protein